MEDIDLIRRAITLYGMLNDDERYEEFGDLFTEDGEYIATRGAYVPPGFPAPINAKGRENIVAALKESARVRNADGSKHRHFCGPPLIDIDGHTADAWWDVVFIKISGGGMTIQQAGRIYARLVKQGDVWRFQKRLSYRSGPDPAADVPMLPAH